MFRVSCPASYFTQFFLFFLFLCLSHFGSKLRETREENKKLDVVKKPPKRAAKTKKEAESTFDVQTT